MKVKKIDLQKMYIVLQGWKRLSNDNPELRRTLPTIFVYALNINLDLITSHIKAMEEAIKQPPEFEQYEKERIDLCIACSYKDSNGRSKIKDNAYVLEKVSEFNSSLAELRVKYKETIDSYTKLLKNFDETIGREEVDIEFYQVGINNFPASNLSSEELLALKPMIRNE